MELYSKKLAFVLLLISLDFALSATVTSTKSPPTPAPRRKALASAAGAKKSERDLAVRKHVANTNSAPRTSGLKSLGRLFGVGECSNKTGSVIDLSFITDAIGSLDDYLAGLQNSTSDGSLTDVVSSVSTGGFKLIKFLVPKIFVVGIIIIGAVIIGTVVLPAKYKPDNSGLVDWLDHVTTSVLDAVDGKFGKFKNNNNNNYEDYSSSSGGGWSSYGSESAADWNKRRQGGIGLMTTGSSFGQQQQQQQQQASEQIPVSYQNYQYMPQAMPTSAIKYRRNGSTAETTDINNNNFFPAEATNEVRSLRAN